ncbi:MAG TPA: hypothetical protein VI704_02475 [Bacteroidota bacterium]|nr:hypothetical protein [Bacteroidota bacterium]
MKKSDSLASFCGNCYSEVKMNALVKHIPLALMLAAYSVVGVVGHAEEWTSLLSRRFEHQVSAASNGSTPFDSRPVWTQQKHVPAAVRESLSTPDLPVTGNNSLRTEFLFGAILTDVHVDVQNVASQHTSRAPPLT